MFTSDSSKAFDSFSRVACDVRTQTVAHDMEVFNAGVGLRLKNKNKSCVHLIFIYIYI